MKIIFFGTPGLVIPILDSLCNNFEISAVVTAPDKPVGRKQIITPSAIAVAYGSYLADPMNEYNLLKPERIDENFVDEIRKLEPDLFVVAAYGGILPASLLAIPKLGAINVHPSLLPKYRGASPIQSAILQGDTETGVTFMKMDEQLDHGPIIFQITEPINPQDTFETLGNRLFEIAGKYIVEVINKYAENGATTPQNDTEATYCKTLKREDGFIDLSTVNHQSSLININNMIRAYYPWPGVWTKFNDKIIKLYPAGVMQMEGKNPVPMHVFINTYPEFGELLKKLELN